MTPERLAFLRGPMGGGRMLTAEECRELADAYERQAEDLSEAEAIIRRFVRARCAQNEESVAIVEAEMYASRKGLRR